MSTLFETHPAPPVFGPKTIAFVVFGTPVPQGSTKAFIPRGWNRPVITNDNTKTKPWRQQVAASALALNLHPFGRETALEMSLDFYFAKPPSVSKKRLHPIVKPDTDKLIRAILDSLTGILYHDDAQVVRFTHIEKHYGSPERVEIQIAEVNS